MHGKTGCVSAPLISYTNLLRLYRKPSPPSKNALEKSCGNVNKRPGKVLGGLCTTAQSPWSAGNPMSLIQVLRLSPVCPDWHALELAEGEKYLPTDSSTVLLWHPDSQAPILPKDSISAFFQVAYQLSSCRALSTALSWFKDAAIETTSTYTSYT